MKKFLIGKKGGMTQQFRNDGTVVPVTVLHAGPCTVTQVRTDERDGYKAVQLGYQKAKNVAKPQKGHFKDLQSFHYLREFRVDDAAGYERGKELKAELFTAGDTVVVTGISKGRGFAGVVKRHGFHGSPATHGHKDQHRMPGSIGATDPQKVFKGTRMAGQMGNARSTVRNLEVVGVDAERGELYVRGAVPGARNGLVLIESLNNAEGNTNDQK